MMTYLIWSLVLFCATSFAQESAGSSVASNLRKCYNQTSLLNTDNRLPATIETLIALIRKIEDNLAFPSNRELSAQILQRFRQDGITKAFKGDIPSKYGIPYSPKQWNSYRNIVLLKKIIPLRAELDTSMLTDLEQCSLHFLLSKAVDYRARGDEQVVCSQIGKYRRRQRRQISAKEQIEQLDAELEGSSSCPVELGVISTKWGAVFPGSVLSGISSGFFYQEIPVNGTSSRLDSRYGATIAGDLAEAALYQISRTGGQSVQVGTEGNWNNTLEPKWYFVKRNRLLQMTDAEIRGGLDGLYLGLKLNDIRAKYQDIKISQILDLYYSSRGLYNNELKACNRKKLETSLTSTDKLVEQTAFFETLLDPVATLDSSIDPQKYKELAELAVNSFNLYLPQNLNDPICAEDNGTIHRLSSDLTIFFDLTYAFKRIHHLLSYLLDNSDVNEYNSKFSLVNGKTSETIINSSRSLLDYHRLLNKTIYDNWPKQTMDFQVVLDSIEASIIGKLNNHSRSDALSIIYLIVTRSVPTETEKSYAAQKLEVFKQKYPDLRILVLGVGQKTNYKDFVINVDADIFIIPDQADSDSVDSQAQLKTTMDEFIKRMKSLPQVLINPNCGADTQSTDKSTFAVIQTVEPNGANIYKISPNYFYVHGDNAMLKVKGYGYGSLKVCTAGMISNFSPSNTSLDCKTINSDEMTKDISNYCTGSFSECDPIFVMVKGQSSYFRCAEKSCRFPDSIKYAITLELVGCCNGGMKTSLSILSLVYALLSYLYFKS